MPANLIYRDFFRQAVGKYPFPYQEAFQQRTPQSFCILEAPTGAGKTEAMVCDWLYGRVTGDLNTPTRLAIASPLRTLVEQTHQRVEAIVARLKLNERIKVCLMMGGRVENDWDLDLSREVILVGTQDQIISRQLNRGYCLSRYRWPIHFAALNNDCRIIVDETQLQGAGYRTAVILQKFRDEIGSYGATQLILCSATFDGWPLRKLSLNTDNTFSVGEADYQHEYLGQKLLKPKKLQRAKTVWKGHSSDDFVDSLRNEILELHQGGLTLIVLNRVDSAQKLYRSLLDTDIDLKLIHSRFRRGDRQALVENLQSFQGIIISTQCVEAGVDLDARLLITELCPWASFVQRCGRAGRNDTSVNTFIYWLDHAYQQNWICFPYELDEINTARSLISRLDDASIKSLLAVDSPEQKIQGQAISQKDLDTDYFNNLKDEVENITSYIRETKEKTNVFISWRKLIGNPADDFIPHEDEICAVPIDKVRAFKKSGWRLSSDSENWHSIDLSQVKAGDRILLTCKTGGYSPILGWTGEERDIPEPIKFEHFSDRDRRDSSCVCRREVSLTQHSLDARHEMSEILTRLKHIVPSELTSFLLDVAQWHDVGKAHHVFQTTLGGSRNNLLAKSKEMKKHSRAYFRHELASALIAMEMGKPFLFVYLVCCHHGKVRTDIGPLKNEENKKSQWYSRGVKEGDSIFGVDLGPPAKSIEPLKVSYQNLSNQNNAPPWVVWKEKVRELRKDESMGIYRLAYLETLVRCADGIASSKY